MKLLVSITTLPSRIGRMRPTLDSLHAQSRLPDAIYLSIPSRSEREKCAYDVPPWMEEYPQVTVVRSPRDYGPGTKLLGCLQSITEPSCLVIADDDLAYRPYFLDTLYSAQTRDLRSSFSFFVYSWGALKSIGQGADGFSFYTPNLDGILDFAKDMMLVPHLKVHDDIWISAFLQRKGINVRSVQTLKERVHGEVHRENQLQDLSGDLSRDSATRKGVQYLVSKGYLGRWLQGDHHMRQVIKRCIGHRA